MTYSDDQVLATVVAWREQQPNGARPLQLLMAWEILARLEAVSTDGPMEHDVLNSLMARSAVEIVPVVNRLRRTRRDGLIDVSP